MPANLVSQDKISELRSVMVKIPIQEAYTDIRRVALK